jgi:hypothetical protein
LYPYSIREIRFESGERFPLLVYSDPLGLPVPGATEFGLVKLRARGLRRSSIRQRTDALGWILYFLDSKKIDLVKKAADGFFLSLNELVALADHCRARRKSAKGRLVVSVAHAAVRYSLALDYIEWVSEPDAIGCQDGDASMFAVGLELRCAFRFRCVAQLRSR